MSFSETISPFFGRCILVWFYVTNAMNILGDWRHVADQMALKHIPLPPLLLVLVLLVVAMGCISLLFGWNTRHGAVMLFGMTVVATVTMHDFWHYGDPGARAAEFGIFARNLAICGGLLMIVGMGAGPFAVDNAGGGKAKRR